MAQQCKGMTCRNKFLNKLTGKGRIISSRKHAIALRPDMTSQMTKIAKE